MKRRPCRSRARRAALAASVAAVLAAAPLGILAGVAGSEAHAFRVVTVTSGLDHPWGLAFLPDGRMLVTERVGRLRMVTAEGRLDPEPVAGVPRVASSASATTAAFRPTTPSWGWRGRGPRSTPSGTATCRPRLRSEDRYPLVPRAWSAGWRQAERGAPRRQLRLAGHQLWPVISYGREYLTRVQVGEGTHRDGMAQPAHQWTPSIAPSGLTVYDGDRFPRWRGNLFVGALKFRLLARLVLEGERVVHEERLLEGRYGRIRDVRTGPDGLLYLLTDAPAPYGVEPRINGEQRTAETPRCGVGCQGVAPRQAASRLLRCAPALRVTRRNPLTQGQSWPKASFRP